MKNNDVSTIFKPLGKIFKRFHTTLFIIVIVAGLAYAVLSLNNLLMEAANTTGGAAANNSTSFDQATIDRIKQLYTSDQAPTTITLPSGRINPFVE